MTREEKIEILKKELSDREKLLSNIAVQTMQLKNDIETYKMMIERVDEVHITEDSIEFIPKEEKKDE